ncbi:MAG: ABC transporter substrate-binding protein [Christensenellales bacterium]|jgi:peptide/nickel transport system substrate-binding protein
MKKTLSILLVLVMVLALCASFATAEGLTYTESPVLAAKVAAGELPAVAERLPVDPEVIEVAEVGTYGGTWRQAVISGNFNHAHSHVTGYLNYNGIIYARDKQTITTGYLSEFSYNEDYTEFYFKLREGLKWSDGAPCTTADVEFWFNDVVFNAELTPSNTYYGEAKLIVNDETSFTLAFDTPKPMYPSYWAYSDNSRLVYPRHYLEQFHASYAEDIDAVCAAENFNDWRTMFEDKSNDQTNVALPILGPYIMTVDPATTNVIVFERNPYYWAVDQNGQQLPYIDSAVINVVESTDQMNQKVIAGEVDVQVAGVQESFSNYPLFAQYAEAMGYSIGTSDFNEPNAMNFHFNITNVDPVKAPYLSNLDFRKALSLGMDRATVIKTFYTVGPYSSEIAQTSFLGGSAYYDETWAKQFTEFDAAAANALLDGLGMTSYDANGYRMTANGEEFNLVVLCPSFDAQWIEVVEMVCAQWRENLKLNITGNEVDPSLWGERTAANDYDITNLTGSDGFLALGSNAVSTWCGNAGYNWGCRFMPGMYLKDSEFAYTEDKEYHATLTRLRELGTAITNETDTAKRDEQIGEVIQIWTDGLFSLGIGRRLPAINIIKNNFHNVAGLDQDWAFGFCGSSRSDTYWCD